MPYDFFLFFLLNSLSFFIFMFQILLELFNYNTI